MGSVQGKSGFLSLIMFRQECSMVYMYSSCKLAVWVVSQTSMIQIAN